MLVLSAAVLVLLLELKDNKSAYTEESLAADYAANRRSFCFAGMAFVEYEYRCAEYERHLPTFEFRAIKPTKRLQRDEYEILCVTDIWRARPLKRACRAVGDPHRAVAYTQGAELP